MARILVIDDEHDMRMMVRLRWSSPGTRLIRRLMDHRAWKSLAMAPITTSFCWTSECREWRDSRFFRR